MILLPQIKYKKLMAFVLLVSAINVQASNLCQDKDYACLFKEGVAELKREAFGPAERYFSLACEGEYPLGCYALGVLAKRDHNWEKARDYFRQACNLKYDKGCMNLAMANGKVNDSVNEKNREKAEIKESMEKAKDNLVALSPQTQLKKKIERVGKNLFKKKAGAYPTNPKKNIQREHKIIDRLDEQGDRNLVNKKDGPKNIRFYVVIAGVLCFVFLVIRYFFGLINRKRLKALFRPSYDHDSTVNTMIVQNRDQMIKGQLKKVDQFSGQIDLINQKITKQASEIEATQDDLEGLFVDHKKGLSKLNEFEKEFLKGQLDAFRMAEELKEQMGEKPSLNKGKLPPRPSQSGINVIPFKKRG